MKVAIIGYGKMGREIERILGERGHEVALIVDVDNAGDLNAATAANVDVAIEFTAPSAALGNIEKCLELGVPVVCGTTGWVDRLADITRFCERAGGAFFWASNYSVGVNIVFELNRRLAAMMNSRPEFDVTVEETHHTEKRDAPSGTAITLAEDIVAGLDRKTRETLQVVSTRRGVATGTHTVIYESPTDIITIRHDIKNRTGLAMGAVLAAEFLIERVAAGEGGVFTMKDLLKI